MAKKKVTYAPSTLDDLIAGGLRYDDTLSRAAPEEAPPQERSMLRAAGDYGVSLLKGAVSVPEAVVGLADIPTGGRVGRALEGVGFRPRDAKAALDEMYSDQQKQAFQAVQDAEGFGGKLAAAVQNPSVIAHTVAESLPAMGAGGVAGRGLLAAVPRIGAGGAAAAGEGIIGAGSAAEQIRQETPDGLTTPMQSGLALASGGATMLFGALGNKISKSLGIADVDTMLVGAAAKPAAAKGVVRRVLEGAASEGILEELPQSVSEQVMQNVALGRDVTDGVDQAAVLGVLSGAAMGGGVNVMHAGRAAPAPDIPGAETAPPAAPAAPAAPAGPLSRAAGAIAPQAVDSTAAPAVPGQPDSAPPSDRFTPEEVRAFNNAYRRDVADPLGELQGQVQADTAYTTPTDVQAVGQAVENAWLRENVTDATPAAPAEQPIAAPAATLETEPAGDPVGQVDADVRETRILAGLQNILDAGPLNTMATVRSLNVALGRIGEKPLTQDERARVKRGMDAHAGFTGKTEPAPLAELQPAPVDVNAQNAPLEALIPERKPKPEQQPAPAKPQVFATYDEADSYRREQRRRGASVTALPVATEGGFTLAVSGTPEYSQGVALRNERRAAKERADAGILDGDILNRLGKPYTVRLPAINAAKKAGPGHQVVQVTGGFVVRKGDADVRADAGVQRDAEPGNRAGGADAAAGVGTVLGRADAAKPAAAAGARAAAAPDEPGAVGDAGSADAVTATGPEVTQTQSGETYKSWKKAVPLLGWVNGWTLFHDRLQGDRFVLMTSYSAAGFDSEAAARAWAKKNKANPNGPYASTGRPAPRAAAANEGVGFAAAPAPQEPAADGTAAGGRAGLLSKVDVRALDSINVKAGTSAAEQGRIIAGGPVFSRAPASGPATPGRVDSVQRAVDEITSKWENAPRVVVAQNIDDPKVPQAIRTERDKRESKDGGEVRAVYHGGTVYLLADQLPTDAHVAIALFHESLGHAGLRGAFGEALTPILRDIARLRRADIATKAREYGLDMANEEDRLTAAEEVLAEWAQRRPEIGWVRRAVAVIRQWLRQNMPGLAKMRMTDNEIVGNFLMPARGWVERGRNGEPASSGVSSPAFSTKTPPGVRVEKLPFRLPNGNEWAVKTTNPRGGETHAYYATEKDAREAVARRRLEANRAAGQGARWWVESPTEFTRSTGFGGLSSVDRANAVRATLDGRRSAVKSRADGLSLEQDPARAGFCFKLAAEASASGVGDMVIGAAADSTGDPIWHAVVMRDGMVYDPTFMQWFDSGVYEDLGFKPALTLSTEQVQAFIQRTGEAPTSRNQGMGDAPGEEGTRFSRAATPGALNDPRQFREKASQALTDLFDAPGAVGWWHKTVGTMHNMAKRSPKFGRVFDAVQGFLQDVSHYAAESADLAPNILPKLETWKDITKSPLSAEDTKAIAAPIFEGTLTWTRDADGKLVPASGVDDAPAGVVFTDAELRERFKATPKQIGLYREFRAAVDKSLNRMTISEMLRFGGKDVAAVRDMAMDAGTAMEAAEVLRQHLSTLAEEKPARKAVLADTAARITEKAERAQELIDRGYAPLSRFGHYTLDVLDENGGRAYFGMFESRAEANRMARRMRENFPKGTITQGTVSEQAYKMFAGITPETLELFGDMVGLEADGDEAQHQLFQQYLKLAKANRSAMKRLIHRKGIAGFDEDAGRVLAGFVYSNARLTSTNLHTGEISQATADIPKTEGQLKDMAIKLADYVRNPQEEAQAIRGLMFVQYLGGSLASAMVNMTQPVAVTMPYLSQWGGAVKSAGRMRAALADVMKKTTGDKALDAALAKAEDDGIVAPQEVHQLMAQARGRSALQAGDGTMLGNARAKAGNALSKVALAWGKPFAAAEQFNRRVTFIAAYRTAVAEGIANPARFAEEAIRETQFVYNKGNKPQWARGAIGGTLFTFKQYSISYVELLQRLYQSGPEGKRAAAFAIAMLFLMGGAGGLPFVGDAEDILDGIMQRLGYSFSTKQARRQFLIDTLGEGAAGFVERGVSGLPGVPIDVAGRLGMGNLIPATGLLTKKADYGRDVAEILGPVGDFAQRVFQGAGQVASGSPVQGIATMSPKAIANVGKALDMYQTGMYRDQKGRKVVDVDGIDALIKGIGFQPTGVALVQDATGTQQGMIAQNSMMKTELADAMAQAMFERDSEAQAAVREHVQTWNRRNPESPVSIDMQGVRKRLAAMRSSKAERVAKAAPAGIRAEVRRALAESP